MNLWGRAFVCLSFLFFGFFPVTAGAVEEREEPAPGENVATVFVKVAVSDSMNRYVAGLKKENFRITEDRAEQEILYFEQSPAPASIGIIFDVSGSMKANADIKKGIAAIPRFLESGNPGGEYLLITFNHNIKLEKDFNQPVSSFQNEVVFQEQSGDTALYDAVYLGLSRVMKGKNDRKALILITDGEDNSSRYPKSEVLESAKESDVQIYSICYQGEYNYGYPIIEKLVGVTGGRAFYTKNFNELDYFLKLIRTGLDNQYILGYKPANRLHDGKWRRIKVKLDPPKKLPKLNVYTREGYYAPKN